MPLIDALSHARLATYVNWAGGDQALALKLYAYNSRLSASLYDPLHIAEITLRNATDRQFRAVYGPAWLDGIGVGLTQYQVDSITKARQTLTRQGKLIAHDPTIAELNFGFWTSFFGKHSYKEWQHLRPMFSKAQLQRVHVAGLLDKIRDLRNRIAHHEPILRLPLDERYTSILELVEWMEPEAATWIQENATWPGVFLGGPTLVLDPVANTERAAAHIITGL